MKTILFVLCLVFFGACGPMAEVASRNEWTVAPEGQPPPATGINNGGTTCLKTCGQKTCGSDGCGGVCGTCADGQVCGASGCQAPSNPAAACPAGVEYCKLVTTTQLQCVTLTGAQTNGTCDTKQGSFTANGHPYEGGVTVPSCTSAAGATNWVVEPKNLHSPIGGYQPYEDFKCKYVGSGSGSGSGGTTTVGNGDVTCTLERLDSSSWIKNTGGGYTSVIVGTGAEWIDFGTAKTFTVKAGYAGFAILPQVTASQWAYGSVSGHTADQVIGTWRVTCAGMSFTYEQGSGETPKTPACSATPTVGQPCLYSSGNDRRLVGRLR